MHAILRSTVLAVAAVTSLAAQQAPPRASGSPTTPPAGVNIPTGLTPPSDYVIGPDDVLAVVFWRQNDMSAEVAVRPDGKISLPLLNEVQAAGMTPEQLRLHLAEAAVKYVTDPTVSVVVKAINSRKVYITGQVGKPGPYALTGPTTVMQLIAMAGGVHEFADSKNITILRTENGKQTALRFNYKEVEKRKNLKQNIELKPGDTIIVP